MPETLGEFPPILAVPTNDGPSTLAALLNATAEVARPSHAELALEDRLVHARLGVASGLFWALRSKHSPTAQHCLRVALRCSALGSCIGLDSTKLDHLEIAALLHDVGKIGVPDRVLTKPASLCRDEAEIMYRHREAGLKILSSFCDQVGVLDTVRCAPFRFDGLYQEPPVISGVNIPLGARILSIADAFDAMTTDHVYRKAFSRERALNELFKNAGTQFDPDLVRQFAELSSQSEAELQRSVSNRWSRYLTPEAANQYWALHQTLLEHEVRSSPAILFQQKLLDTMCDGVVFIDARNRIVLWNRGIENMTGLSRESVMEKNWDHEFLKLRDLDGNLIRESTCPVQHVLRTGMQTLRRLTLTHDNGDRCAVDVHVIPVIDRNHECFGVTMLLHDVSSEIDLERRVENLHEQATTDPLTQVQNRAEFDRIHKAMVEESLENGTTFSIVICDIDHFKSVNDVHGHQAGDAALVAFAALLRQHAREADVVSRYGGEEFVMICPDCDNASATRLAEQIRFELANTPQPMLAGKPMTASFGVTEVQMGDSPETMLRRADRALYEAKDGGRNRVVQLGAGLLPDSEANGRGWLSWMQRRPLDCLLERWLVVNVPVNLLVEKIKGFISDHDAEIVEIKDNFILLQMSDLPTLRRRQSDRPITITVELAMEPSDDPHGGSGTQTYIHVRMRPKRARDRRRQGEDQALHVMASLKSYLIIAQECASRPKPNV